MITRQLGKILRGKATPFQIVAACVLGAMIGFAPGFRQAPALWVLLIGLLLVVNANLGVAGLVGGAAKLLSLVMAPVSFQVGRALLDGPTEGLARTIVNSRVLAWCGLEYYAVTGGQVIAVAVGAVVGLLLARGLTSFRKRMLAAQDQPSKMKELAAKPGAKLAVWLFFGSAAKGTWEDKLSKKVGNPVRVWGAAMVVVVLGGSWVAHGTILPPFARSGMKIGLEEVNGATVDVGDVQLDLTEGRFAVSDLAMADPNDLTRDLFRAAGFEADIDEADLLRRRVHVAKLVISEASSGAQRAEKGERIAPRAAAVVEKAASKTPDPSDMSLEQVIEEYEVWQERLTQARRWLDRLSGAGKQAEGEETKESLSERLAREVRAKGWLKVEASQLLVDQPTFRLSELAVDGLTASWMPGRTFDVKGRELSTHPWLVDTPPKLEIASRDGAVGLLVNLAPVSKQGGDGRLAFHWKGLAVDDVMSKLKLGGKAPLSGGTLDIEIDGAWLGGKVGEIDLPLRVTFRDTTLTMKGIDPTKLTELVLPIGLKGPIDSPAIRFDGQRFSDALVAAGKSELAKKVRGELEGKVGEELEKLGADAGIDLPSNVLDKAKSDPGGLLEGVLGGKQESSGGSGGKKKKPDGGSD